VTAEPQRGGRITASLRDPTDADDRPVTRRAVEWADRAAAQLTDSVKETVRPVARRGPVLLLRRAWSKAWQDRIFGLSAETAFWQLLSLPPLFLALLGSLGYISGQLGSVTVNRVEQQLVEVFGRAFTPGVVDQLVAPIISEVLRRGRPDVISIGFLLSLWAGSSATSTFVNTITIAYDMRDVRGAVRSRLLALWLYLLTVVIGVVLLPLLVLGPSEVVKLAPQSVRGDVVWLVGHLYWPSVIVLLLLGLVTLYHLAPPRRLRWLAGLPGALLAMGVFILGGVLLRHYITFVVTRAFSYGALAAPIAALLFLYLLAFAVLLGAELNAAIEQTWPSPPSRRERRRERKAATATTGQPDERPVARQPDGQRDYAPPSPPPGSDS